AAPRRHDGARCRARPGGAATGSAAPPASAARRARRRRRPPGAAFSRPGDIPWPEPLLHHRSSSGNRLRYHDGKLRARLTLAANLGGESAMRLHGSCRCKAVRFSLRSTTPYPYMRCYCSVCRKTAGGGGYAINIMGQAESLEVEGGEHIAIWRASADQTDEGGPGLSPAR